MWTIELLNDEVADELKALPVDQQAKFTWIADLIKKHGLQNVHEPYVKHLEQGLWEIRMKGKDGISRAFLVVAKGSVAQIVVWGISPFSGRIYPTGSVTGMPRAA